MMENFPQDPTHERPSGAVRNIDVLLGDDPEMALLVKAALTYKASDPFAVNLIIETPKYMCLPLERGLLREGLVEPAGDGDIHVFTELDSDDNGTLFVEGQTPDGPLLLQTDRVAVSKFLDETFQIVPAGTEPERIDWDTELQHIFPNDPDSPNNGSDS